MNKSFHGVCDAGKNVATNFQPRHLQCKLNGKKSHIWLQQCLIGCSWELNSSRVVTGVPPTREAGRLVNLLLFIKNHLKKRLVLKKKVLNPSWPNPNPLGNTHPELDTNSNTLSHTQTHTQTLIDVE